MLEARQDIAGFSRPLLSSKLRRQERTLNVDLATNQAALVDDRDAWEAVERHALFDDREAACSSHSSVLGPADSDACPWTTVVLTS